MNPDHEKLLKKDTQRLNRQDTLQDGMFAKMAEVEAALHGVGEKHEVLFIGNTVVNCRKLAGKLNMFPGISCRYEQFGEKVPHDTDTIVIATYDPAILDHVKEIANGASIVIMSQDGVPPEVLERFPKHFIAWNPTAAFGHITSLAEPVDKKIAKA
jgi:hypothetical protein